MFKKCLAGLVLVVLAPLAARAGGEDRPAAVVRFRSLDALVDNVKLIVTLAGNEGLAQQVEGLIKAKIGAQGLEGIDPARPFGAYARFGKGLEDIGGAVLIPIASEKAFLTLLDNLDVRATKEKNDIYKLQTPAPVEVYLRFANRYAYVTALNPTWLEGKLADPEQVLGKDSATFSATIRLDEVPEGAKQLAIAQLERGLQSAAKTLPNETPGQQAVRTAAAKEFTNTVVGVLKEGGDVKLAVDVSGKTKELSATVSLTPKPGTPLAQTIQKLGQGSSQFGKLRGANAAFRGLTHVVLPDDVKAGFSKLLDEGAAEGLAKIQDAGKRQQAQQLMDVLMPSLKAGELDGCVQLLGPTGDQKYAALVAIKVKDGVKLGAKLREMVEEALKQVPEAQRALVKLDHASAGSIKIHRLDLPPDQNPVRDLQKTFGETSLYVAFRDDAAFLALGQDSLQILKDAIGAAATGPSPLLLYEVDFARLVPIIAPTEDKRVAARNIFRDAQDGMARLSLEGGAALRLSISTRLPVVQFLSQIR